MIEFEAVRATLACGQLSEGPVWDALRECVLWVDIVDGLVHQGELRPDGSITGISTRKVPGTVGAVAVSCSGTLAIAARDSVLIAEADSPGRVFSQVLQPDSGRRLNDAATDPAGRLYVGTLSMTEPSESETLVRIEDDGRVVVIDDDLTLSNGIAWSPAGDRMFTVDSLRRTIYTRKYHPATGVSGSREVFIEGLDAIPDGICTDRDGGVWVALWGAAQVRRYGGDGAPSAVIRVPAPHVSSVGFAGADLDTLVITTARQDLSAARLARNPDSGALFTAHVDVPGTPVAPWRGPLLGKAKD
ncbi:SMP-30/gluconolactonase/LRE family protein [Nocardia niwae]|uniref:SMP-30/gluconolactonase/LRE family protein n=1 Tax=Nocardia niwae TaxID=626084 RepID=UPI0007A458AC|nr:SMP-30/gluconolactonase/LRE family protein [Nocardia niwae]